MRASGAAYAIRSLARLGYQGWQTATFRPYRKRIDVLGKEYDFFVADQTGRSWYDVPGRWAEHAELRWTVERILVPGDTVLYCGSHHGLTALPMAERILPVGLLHCVDAQPRNCVVANRNFKLNGITNATAHACAVGDSDGCADVLNTSTSSITASRFQFPRITVPMRTIDALSHDLGITPNALVMDIEGYECLALAGARKVLASRPKMAIEVHPRQAAAYGSEQPRLSDLLPPNCRLFVLDEDKDGEVLEVDAVPERLDRYHLYVLPD